MNNLSNLIPCIDSITLQTQKVSYEIIVVAYLFSKENSLIIREKYPFLKIIESDEIRGFSENNNLASHQAQGKYCFILNDDTKFDTPVIDSLVESMEKTPKAVIMSPKILYEDGSTQWCGRPKITIGKYILRTLRLWNETKIKSPYTNQKGIFRTFNISGAAFMIKTDIFRELGFFNETYFFCPEDVALSTLANKKGYECYVNESIYLFHLGGLTFSNSKISLATHPTGIKGDVLFYSDGSLIKKYILIFVITIMCIIEIVYCGIKYIAGNRENILRIRSLKNVISAMFSSKTPKEIFLYYYNKKVKKS